MVQYLDAFQQEFDCCFKQICASVDPEPGKTFLQAIEPDIWKVLGVKKQGHKFVLARAICQKATEMRCGDPVEAIVSL